ncbi:MAG: hypothetical protein H0S85_01175 [Desulfovibrionaceae bacterium]|jgi:hypothetical protein|nr:hypothetical protein [Desulfovibrionaceae bacterium]
MRFVSVFVRPWRFLAVLALLALALPHPAALAGGAAQPPNPSGPPMTTVEMVNLQNKAVDYQFRTEGYKIVSTYRVGPESRRTEQLDLTKVLRGNVCVCVYNPDGLCYVSSCELLKIYNADNVPAHASVQAWRETSFSLKFTVVWDMWD